MSVIDFVFENFGNMAVTIGLCIYFHFQFRQRREFEENILKVLREMVDVVRRK